MPAGVRRGVARPGAAAGRPARHLAPGVLIVAETSLPAVCAHVEELRPDVLAIDSIQSVHDPDSPGAAGSVAQVRDGAQRLVRLAKDTVIATLLVGHVTKDGALAGPRTLEHVVDTVLSFEGDRHHALRMLRALKHRFGSTDELGLMEMRPTGWSRSPIPARCSSPTAAGQSRVGRRARARRRPAAVRRGPGPRGGYAGADPAPRRAGARRQPAGDAARGAAATGAGRVRRSDVYASVAGGVRVVEPGADLAVLLAVASASADRPIADETVALGEVGLGGEVRQVPQSARRLAEALRLGFRRAIVPPSTPDVRGSNSCGSRGYGDGAGGPSAWPDGRRQRSAWYPRGRTTLVRIRLRVRFRREERLASARSEALYGALRLIAPGTPLREGIDRILQAKMGALIVVGDGPEVLHLCSGGFLLDAEFTPQRLSELAKMDGAIILAADGSRVARANVHLVPTPTSPPARPVPATAPPSASPARSRCP